MATEHTYSYNHRVRYKLELVREGNVLRVGGDVTSDGMHFVLDSALGLLDSRHSDVVLDLRGVAYSTDRIVDAVNWMINAAESRDKSLDVLASGDTFTRLLGAGLGSRVDREPALSS